MSDNTKIEWTDATWNPITGCSVVSAGCKNCYAMKLAGTRLQHHPSRAGLTIDTGNGPVWNGQVRFNEQWLDQPLKWKRPRMIFVCAHGDLFHESVPDDWIDEVFAVMAMAPQHTFQVLTKRPKRMRDYLSDTDLENRLTGLWWADVVPAFETWKPILPMSNVWLGVSVENQETADERIPLLLETPAAVRWISAEPLLGPVDLRTIDVDGHYEVLPLGAAWLDRLESGQSEGPRLDWVVVGGESGSNSRPMHPAWARSLRDQCQAADVPFLFKQWGQFIPADQEECPCGPPHSDWMWADGSPFERGDGQMGIPLFRRVGKKVAGRILDDRTWDEYPKAAS